MGMTKEEWKATQKKIWALRDRIFADATPEQEEILVRLQDERPTATAEVWFKTALGFGLLTTQEFDDVKVFYGSWWRTAKA